MHLKATVQLPLITQQVFGFCTVKCIRAYTAGAKQGTGVKKKIGCNQQKPKPHILLTNL